MIEKNYEPSMKTAFKEILINQRENLNNYKKPTTFGFKVRKKKKPFKSGLMVNTVKGVINHPILNIPAYTFYEDDSFVECWRCIVVTPEEVTTDYPDT
jgi:hypothetical protein